MLVDCTLDAFDIVVMVLVLLPLLVVVTIGRRIVKILLSLLFTKPPAGPAISIHLTGGAGYHFLCRVYVVQQSQEQSIAQIQH